MIDRGALLRDLQKELAALAADVRRRTVELPEYDADLRGEHRRAFDLKRTAATYGEWRDRQVTQAAVAWLLGCVFVRFCEDNALVAPVWLAGPPERRGEAVDAHTAYFHAHPERNDRDWLLEAFGHLRDLPPAAAIFNGRNPLWRLRPSADEAERLVRFWRRTGAAGGLVHDLRDERLDTRFLGDLYQDLSEQAREQYALLQTPEFVEEFILDRTLERAIEERGIEGLRLIDPACGSGHFLLGAFARLLERWHRQAPGMDARERVQKVLDSIHGVDLNPFSIAIAEFRLSVAALLAGGDRSLERAPGYRYNLAVGDSLLHGQRQMTLDEAAGNVLDADAALSGFTYAAEDLEKLREILQVGRYDVVVANPPYITVKDGALRDAYRQRYRTCSGKYALTVPFIERLFELARPVHNNGAPGWVGQITSNSFMKREFGKRLIEEFLTHKDLVEVIDTSGAYIPGHGTPTVILVGRNQAPVGTTIRAVLGVRGEPSAPAVPAKGLVWATIIDNVGNPGTTTAYVTIADLPRKLLRRHPWSLAGGGAVDLRQRIESAASRRLGNVATDLGITSVTGEDDLYVLPDLATANRRHVEPTRRLVLGDGIREWLESGRDVAVWTYDDEFNVVPLSRLPRVGRHLWPARSSICRRRRFGTPMLDRGLTWYEWQELYAAKLKTPLTIAFAFVATHNHFVLDRGGKVFNRSAPVIKLPRHATEDDHPRLLGLLNSSTACFWLKQVCHNKGAGGGARVDQGYAALGADNWENHYEFTGTKLEEFPIPRETPLQPARELDALAQELATATPAAVCAAGTPSRPALDAARLRWDSARGRMIALQEELDWQVYRLYGLLDDDLTHSGDDLPCLSLGERAFEIVLARKVARGEEETAWFERHGSTPITEVPAHWPAAYRELVERRIALIAERPDIALIERPECKRRWATDPWEKQEREALRSWVLDRLEKPDLWQDRQGRPQARSVSQLADDIARDQDLLDVLALHAGSRDYDLATEVGRLLDDESVPFLAALRYAEPGLRKRAEWEEVWALQRREDAGEDAGRIPVPPKYAPADFARSGYWQRRGKLDVPRERFISYPGAERDGDRSPVHGWAGWDHLQQALALATLVLARRQQDGWTGDRLTPLLAGLVELEPWLRQWHAEPDPAFPTPPAAYLSTLLDQQLAEHGLTREDAARWRPEPRARGGRRRRAVSAVPEEPPL